MTESKSERESRNMADRRMPGYVAAGLKAVLVAGWCFCVATVGAESVQMQNSRTKTVKIYPVADAYANSAAPNGFYGTNPEILVRNWGNGSSMKGYLRFKRPFDAAGRIQSATLSMMRITPATVNITYHLHGLKPGAEGQQWKEHGGATWNNAPSNDISSGNKFTDDATEILSRVTFHRGSSGDRLEFPNTSKILDFLNSSDGECITFMVAQGDESGQLNRFASRENTEYEAAVLTLTYITDENAKMPSVEQAKKDYAGSQISEYSEKVFYTGKPCPRAVKYMNSRIPELSDFSGNDMIIGTLYHSGSTYLKLVNTQENESGIAFSTRPLNLDVFLQKQDLNGETMLNGIGGFHQLSVPAKGSVLLRLSKTALTDKIGIQAKLAARRAVALKAQGKLDMKDPSKWNTVPIPLDFITSETMWRGMDDLSGTAYAMWDENFLYIGAVVRDDEDVTLPLAKTGGNNLTDNPDREPTDITASSDIAVREFTRLTEGQDPVHIGDKIEFAFVGNRVSGYNTANNTVVEKQLRKDGKTFYASAIPWSDLKIPNPEEGRWYGFSVLAHDYDKNRYNIALWSGGVIWRKNSALLGMIYLAGKNDEENAIEKSSDIVSLNWEPAAIGCGDQLEIALTGSCVVKKHTKKITLQVLDSAGKLAAAPTVSMSAYPWTSVWKPESLPDGIYTVIATLDVKDRIRTTERRISIATEARKEAAALIETADKEHRATFVGRTDETAMRSAQSLENARRLFKLGRFSIAADSARQTISWCRINTYEVPVPALELGEVSESILTVVPRTVNGVSVWETSEFWCASNGRVIIKIRKKDMALEFGRPSGMENIWQTVNAGPELVFSTPAGKKAIWLADARTRTAHLSAIKQDGAGFLINAQDFPTLRGMDAGSVKIEVLLYKDTDDFTVTIYPTNSSASSRLVSASYPHGIRINPSPENYAVCPIYGGCMIPSEWPSAINLNYDGIYWVAPTWMAFVKGGESLLFFPETPYDINTIFNHTPGASSYGAFGWQSCWEELRYPRRIRYVLQTNGDYVSVAKRFRKHAVAVGYFRSLKDKIAENPSIKSRIGAPVLLSGLYSTLDRVAQGKFKVASWSDRSQAAKKLFDRSLGKAYIHHTQWTSLFAPAEDSIILYPSLGSFFPPNEAAGGWTGLSALTQSLAEKNWVIGLYSNFRDFDPKSSSWNEAIAKKGPNGLSVRRRNPVTPSSFLSAREVAKNKLVTAYYYELLANHISPAALNQIYFDVYAAVPLREDYDPRHPMTREQTAFYQRKVMEEARALGLTVIAEHYADWAVPCQDASWQIMPPAFGVAVPIFQLVYGDAVIAPFALTETNYEDWLRCLLYRQIPRIGFFPSDKLLDWVRILCKVHSAVAQEEMISHRFLDSGKRIQETKFSNGVTIQINLDRKSYRIRGISDFPDSEQLLIP